jgi:hypothetical protein
MWMSAEVEQLYQARLARYVTAMRDEKPERMLWSRCCAEPALRSSTWGWT